MDDGSSSSKRMESAADITITLFDYSILRHEILRLIANYRKEPKEM
jgi:putative heme iron utilization protein